MKRPARNFSLWVAACLVTAIIVGWSTTASAQRRKAGRRPAPAPTAAPSPADKAPEAAPAPAEAAEKPAEAAPAKEEPPPADDLKLPPESEVPSALAGTKGPANLSWEDIWVVPRKSFIKGGRLEVSPFTGMSVNDLLIHHYVFGADLNYFLTDVLWVGLQGQYFLKALTEREELVGLQYNRIPTLNRYLFGASLNFGYVPVYGKFTLFNRAIMHWEIYASAGVGWTRTQIIPRDPSSEKFNTDALTPNAGLGARFFLFNWLTVNFGLRDYVIADKYEDPERPRSSTAAMAKAGARQVLVNNVMLMGGIGIYLPGGFQYKTPR